MAIGDRIWNYRGTYGFLNTPIWLARRKNDEVAAGSKLLYGVLGEDWATTPHGSPPMSEKSLTELSEGIGFSERQTKRFLRQLKDLKLIEVEERRYTKRRLPLPNRYYPLEHVWEGFYQRGKSPHRAEDAEGPRAEDTRDTRSEDAEGPHDSKNKHHEILDSEPENPQGHTYEGTVQKSGTDKSSRAAPSQSKPARTQSQEDTGKSILHHYYNIDLNLKGGSVCQFLNAYKEHNSDLLAHLGRIGYERVDDALWAVTDFIDHCGGNVEDAIEWLHQAFEGLYNGKAPETLHQAVVYADKIRQGKTVENGQEYTIP